MDTIKGECDAAGRSWRAGADHAAGMTAKLAGTLRRAGDSRSASRIGNPEKPDTGSGTSNTIVAEEKRALRDDLPDEEQAIWQNSLCSAFTCEAWLCRFLGLYLGSVRCAENSRKPVDCLNEFGGQGRRVRYFSSCLSRREFLAGNVMAL